MASVSAPPLVALRNILVATDFSTCSQTALHAAAGLARQAKGKIFLAHVMPIEPLTPIPMDSGPAYGGIHIKDAGEQMKQILAAPELASIDHTMLLQYGDFWPALS